MAKPDEREVCPLLRVCPATVCAHAMTPALPGGFHHELPGKVSLQINLFMEVYGPRAAGYRCIEGTPTPSQDEPCHG